MIRTGCETLLPLFRDSGTPVIVVFLIGSLQTPHVASRVRGQEGGGVPSFGLSSV